MRVVNRACKDMLPRLLGDGKGKGSQIEDNDVLSMVAMMNDCWIVTIDTHDLGVAPQLPSVMTATSVGHRP